MKGGKISFMRGVQKTVASFNKNVSKSIFIRGLISAIVLLIFLIYVKRRCGISGMEMFTSYKRCEHSPIKGLYRLILEEEGVNLEQDLEKFDLYYPCGYNKIEKEIK